MTARDMVAAAVIFWLVGAIVGWCAGWAARGEQNRGWHSGVVGQLAQARAQLAQALDEVQDLRAELDDDHRRYQPSPAPSVVTVHLAVPPAWAVPPPQPLIVTAARALEGRAGRVNAAGAVLSAGKETP